MQISAGVGLVAGNEFLLLNKCFAVCFNESEEESSVLLTQRSLGEV